MRLGLLIALCWVLASIPLWSLSASEPGKEGHYRLPFGARQVTMDLEIENASDLLVRRATVRITGLPSWLHAAENERTIAFMKPRSATVVTFAVTVDKTAPVDSEERVTYRVSLPDSQSWNGQFSIALDAPQAFALLGNYPNPFNPTTAIDYELPADANVELTVYNMLGQNVAALVNAKETAGYHSALFDASEVPSGVYFYRFKATLIINGEQGNDFVRMMKMVLLK